MRQFLVLVAALAVAGATTLGCGNSEPAATTLVTSVAPTATATATPQPWPTPTASPTPPPGVVLPRDDAAHSTAMEWWYFNGHLKTRDDVSYGFHYVLFRVFSPELASHVLVAHLGISDHQRGAVTFEQRVGPSESVPQEGVQFALDDWRIVGSRGRFRLAGSVDEYAVNLALSSTKPPVLHDGDGIVEYQVTGDSHYYSYSRLKVTGSLSDRGSLVGVNGTGWMDHQWGDFQVDQIGWDWFSLQLDDGTEVMFYEVRDADGDTILRFGTYVGAEGNHWSLLDEDVSVRPLDTWRSPTTDAAYPHGWEMEIPSLSLSLTLSPVLDDAEFIVPQSEIPTYWEGEVAIEGERRGSSIGGLGFVELVGYAPP